MDDKVKIIGVSNYDNEMVNDILIAENVSEFYAKIIADLLNKDKRTGGDGTYHYKVVPMDYELYKFEP
jgi:hypothetical protein